MTEQLKLVTPYYEGTIICFNEQPGKVYFFGFAKDLSHLSNVFINDNSVLSHTEKEDELYNLLYKVNEEGYDIFKYEPLIPDQVIRYIKTKNMCLIVCGIYK